MITALLSLTLSLQTMPTVNIASVVNSSLFDANSPSCQVVESRLAWMRKQAAEIDRLSRGKLSSSQLRDLEEMRKRWFDMNDELSIPWAEMTARFPLSDLAADQLNALVSGEYQITIHAFGKDWVALKDELPPNWDLSVDAASKILTFSLPATAAEYCSPIEDDWALNIQLSQNT